MSDLDPSRQPRVPVGTALVPVSAELPGVFGRERQSVFLQALAATGAVRAAAARAGVSHQTAYRERLASPAFRRGWDAALLAARCHAEEVLACRAIDGVEEDVIYHGEVVATRRRYDSRLLLAHLARLDRLTADTRVEAFAEDFEAALARFEEGSDAPEVAPGPTPPAQPEETSPGQWSKRSTAGFAPRLAPRFADAEWGEPDPFADCPECGGACLGPEDELTEEDCRWMGRRLERMIAARPPGAKEPEDFKRYSPSEVEMEQLAAFEAGEDEWWLVVPEGPGGDPADWPFAGTPPRNGEGDHAQHGGGVRSA